TLKVMHCQYTNKVFSSNSRLKNQESTSSFNAEALMPRLPIIAASDWLTFRISGLPYRQPTSGVHTQQPMYGQKGRAHNGI
ncbi:MAG: hypothetical protein PVI55_16635, partial [Desulfobacterales bacterium]